MAKPRMEKYFDVVPGEGYEGSTICGPLQECRWYDLSYYRTPRCSDILGIGKMADFEETPDYTWFDYLDEQLRDLHLGALADVVAGLRRQRDEAIAVIEQVEWVPSHTGELYCPWCGAVTRYSVLDRGKSEHKPDCPRQLVLAKARGNEE